MAPVLILVLAVVYLGMVVGTLPRLRIDRTGVALLGAIAVVVLGEVTTAEAMAFVDIPTIALLFGMTMLSAQLRLVGFYTAVSRGIAAAGLTPPALLAAVIAVAGALSAVFTNDIVALAMAPVLVDWDLLVLFVGLFVVNGAAGAAGLPGRVLAVLANVGIRPDQPDWLLPITVVLSNLVSDVPAVILLLPFADGPGVGVLLALASTLAGNLLLWWAASPT